MHSIAKGNNIDVKRIYLLQFLQLLATNDVSDLDLELETSRHGAESEKIECR